MIAKSFRSKHVKKAYEENDHRAFLIIEEHCQANGIEFSRLSDDGGDCWQMKLPDTQVGGYAAELQISKSWSYETRPTEMQWPYGVMIFARKMHQIKHKGGAWWIINALGTHALVLPFDSESIGEGEFYDAERGEWVQVVYFDIKDAELVELGKVNTSLN
jgi:hypothetical protein